MAPHDRPSLSITLPPDFDFHNTDGQMPRTPEAQHPEEHSAVDAPPPPRPQAFKVKRKRVSSARFQEPSIMLDNTVIPTIEMSEAPTDMSSPTLQPTSAHLLSPIPLSASLPRAVTPPKTPAPKWHAHFSQLESPAAEWDLITRNKTAFERSGSICSSFSDSSVSSYGSSDFSLPNGGYDSPDSEVTDPFMDGDVSKNDHLMCSPILEEETPRTKRVKTRRDVKWTLQMDDHLWMTFMAYLSDPTLTPFKMLPGSTPPMGVCDQVSSKAKRTWRPRKPAPVTRGSIDAFLERDERPQEGSPDTIRPSSTQAVQSKWPRVAATRRRLRELCARRPSISAHYQRMLRTRSPSPFETSSPATGQAAPASSSFSGYEMVKSLVTSTAPSMQPDSMLARLASDDEPPARRQQRSSRPDGWFDRVPRFKAHQKSASLQTEPKVSAIDMSYLGGSGASSLDSPFDAGPAPSRSHLLQSLSNTKSLGRTEFNGRSLDSPVEFKMGAPTDRRSRKRRFRSDEEKPRRPALEDVFGPPVRAQEPWPTVRNRGFSVGALRATDNLTRLFTPPSITVDHVMSEAPEMPVGIEDVPLGSRSAPRRLAEPVPRLGSPFMETPQQSRQHNTFPRSSLLPTMTNLEPFHRRLMQLAAQHAEQQASAQQS